LKELREKLGMAQINALRRQVMDKVTRMETTLKTLITESQKDLKKKFQDQEEKSKKTSVASEQKVQLDNERLNSVML